MGDVILLSPLFLAFLLLLAVGAVGVLELGFWVWIVGRYKRRRGSDRERNR
jgi:hypothetical protein